MTGVQTCALPISMATRDIVLIAVRDKFPPFDGSSAPWFDVLRSVTS